MSTLRAEMVEKAKKMKICTQCLKHKVVLNRKQCQACIMRTRIKQQRRKMPSKYKDKIDEFAAKNKICTRCYSRKTEAQRKQCESCLAYRRENKKQIAVARGVRIGKPGRKKGSGMSEAEKKIKRREHTDKYKKKKQYNKARNLSLIRSAIEKGKKL